MLLRYLSRAVSFSSLISTDVNIESGVPGKLGRAGIDFLLMLSLARKYKYYYYHYHYYYMRTMNVTLLHYVADNLII